MPVVANPRPYADLFQKVMGSAIRVLPDRVIYVNGRVEIPFSNNATPATSATSDVVGSLARDMPDVLSGNKGEQLVDWCRAVNQFVLLRIGVSGTEGVGMTLPLNSEQLPDASQAFAAAATTYPPVAAVVAADDVAAVPPILDELKIRLAVHQVFEEFMVQSERGITATYNRLDGCVRKYQPVLKTMESYSGIGVTLRPYYALTEKPAEKAQKTQRVRAEARAEGHAAGLAEAQAAAKKAARKSPTTTQFNVGVTPPGEPTGDDTPAAAPAPRKGKRKSTR